MIGKVARVMKRLEGDLDATQVLDVIGSFTRALDLLDDYDHQTLARPTGTRDVYRLTYEECRAFVDGMKFGKESDLFGNEKDESFTCCNISRRPTLHWVYHGCVERAQGVIDRGRCKGCFLQEVRERR